MAGEYQWRNTAVGRRAREVTQRLHEVYPQALCALHYKSPFELLVATILSAQCTDKRVNEVTPALFKKYRGPQDFARVPDEELQRDIMPTGFFRNKTRSLKGASRVLCEDFQGQVPRTMPELLRLPGVARKTANVVLGTAFGVAEGVVVDTHVTRVSFRLGLTRHKEPTKIEQDLMRLLPRDEWIFFSHALILHGRQICVARKPRCPDCPLLGLCLRRGLPPLKTQ